MTVQGPNQYLMIGSRDARASSPKDPLSLVSESIIAILSPVLSVDKARVTLGSSCSSPNQLRSHSQSGSTSPAVFFSDLEFKRTADLGGTATGNKAGRLDPVCSAGACRALQTSPCWVPGDLSSSGSVGLKSQSVLETGCRRGQANSGPRRGKEQLGVIRALKNKTNKKKRSQESRFRCSQPCRAGLAYS